MQKRKYKNQGGRVQNWAPENNAALHVQKIQDETKKNTSEEQAS